MSTDDFIKILAPIASGLISGLLVATVNHFFTRKKTKAETEKLEAESAKIRVETQKIQSEMSALTSTVKEVSYKLGEPREQIIYDGRSFSDGSHFKGYGDRFHKEPSEKPKGMGSLKIENNILNLQRTNTGGRFRITLLNYSYSNTSRDFLPKNDFIAGKRQLKISCEVKAINGAHTLLFSVKNLSIGSQLDKYEETISLNEWTKVEAYFRIPPNEDCQLWIDDQNVSQANSSLQLRNIVLSEIGS